MDHRVPTPAQLIGVINFLMMRKCLALQKHVFCLSFYVAKPIWTTLFPNFLILETNNQNLEERPAQNKHTQKVNLDEKILLKCKEL